MSWTIEERRSYFRERYHRLRTAWLRENGPCKNCGSSKSLEIDHVDPSTKITSDVWYWGSKRRLEELSKCQVLCEKCHLAKSAAEKRVEVHGTLAVYRRGCRCSDCVEVNRKKSREGKRRRSKKY